MRFQTVSRKCQSERQPNRHKSLVIWEMRVFPMIATSFFDAFAREAAAANDTQASADLLRLAKTYVDSVLSDWQRVLECEDQFGYMTFKSTAEKSKVNRALYEVYQSWAAEAERVLVRARQLTGQGQAVEGGEQLEHAYGHVQARLKMTPELFDRAREQIRQGQGIPMEEVRNGLRARVRT
jgi:hypothetical protein